MWKTWVYPICTNGVPEGKKENEKQTFKKNYCAVSAATERYKFKDTG